MSQSDPLPPDDENLDDSSSEDEDHAESEGSEESEAEAVETLVAGRQRRGGAANRYAQLLLLEQQQAAEARDDDDLALLFEENDEDVEFADPDVAAAVSDEDDDSSTDEEDKGPATAEDDLEGEKQLEKEERAKQRMNKRKAEKALVRPAIRRKRVRMNDEVQDVSQPTPDLVERPRKKSERVSWIPSNTDAPVRASSRTLSVQNKQRTLESMKMTESKRMRQIAVLGAAQRRRDSQKPPMTQAERLVEAARTERHNARSLSKWEEMEKDRIEKQKARLEALQNRKLQGPVVSWYSGTAMWLGDELVRIGKKPNVEEISAKEQEVEASTVQRSIQLSQDLVHEVEETVMTGDKIPEDQVQQSITARPESGTEVRLTEQSDPVTKPAKTDTSEMSSFMDGLEYYASLPSESHKSEARPERVASETVTTATEQSSIPSGEHENLAPDAHVSSKSPTAVREASQPLAPPQKFDQAPTTTEKETGAMVDMRDAQVQLTGLEADRTSPTIKAANNLPIPERAATEATEDTIPPQAITSAPANMTDVNPSATKSSLAAPATPATPPPPTTISTRNLITLLNFDPIAVTSKDIQRRILFSWPAPPPPPHTTTTTRRYFKESASAYNPPKPAQAICVTTGLPARYRDPLTGLPYAGMEAFKALRKLAEGGDKGGVWSAVLQAWVGGGEGTRPAKGVPERFVSGGRTEEGMKAEGIS